MKTFSTSIQIYAPRERVWSALVNDMPADSAAFGILRFEGSLAKDSRIKLWSGVDPERAFAIRVRTFDAPKKMVWQGGMPFGLFTGTRAFELSKDGASTRFDMREVFTGALSRLIVKTIPDLNPSFEKFAQALKEKAENHE